jgi:plastocyanin
VVPPGPLGEGWDPSGEKTVPMHSPAVDPDHGATTHHGPATDDPAATTADEPFAVITTDEGTIVEMVDNRFMPKEIEIEAGTPLTFVNKGANWHSVAGADGMVNIDQLASGESATVTIDTPGTYTLICKHHLRQGMTARLIVSE